MIKSVGDVIKEQNIHLDSAFDRMSRGGFTQIPNFILKDPSLSIGAKLVYAMFLSYAWHNDSCFPGQDRLAQDMGLTRNRVTQLIAELAKAKLVSVQRRGQGMTNLYTIHFQVSPVTARQSVGAVGFRGKPVYLQK